MADSVKELPVPIQLTKIESDHCIICLDTEEESIGELQQNTRCDCKYIYHPSYMTNIVKCPYCNKSYFQQIYTIVEIGLPRLPQSQQTVPFRDDSVCYKMLYILIIYAVLIAAAYYSLWRA